MKYEVYLSCSLQFATIWRKEHEKLKTIYFSLDCPQYPFRKCRKKKVYQKSIKFDKKREELKQKKAQNTLETKKSN